MTEQPIEERVQIYFDYFSRMVKRTLKELAEYFRKKSALPLDIIFQIVIGPDTERRLIEQKKIVLECGQIYDGTDETNQKLIDEFFPKYLRLDNHNAHLRKRDEKYPEAKELIKKLFLIRCSIDHEHLKGSGSSYEEIAKSAFNDKESALATLGKEFEVFGELNDFILKRRRLVNVPGIVRVDVIDATLVTTKTLKEVMFAEMERIFGS